MSAMKLGICTAGCEDVFEEFLRASFKTDDDFTYLEVGIADGTTLLAVAKVVEDVIGYCRIVGVDVPECPVFNPEAFQSRAGGSVDTLMFEAKAGTGLSVYLLPQGVQRPGVVERILPAGINFAFIDGCHGKACAMADFLAVENSIKPGGIVCFHDACEEDQGSSFQAHCQENINVREALCSLGLISQERPGWELIQEVHGDKARNGNGMCFFRKL